jgi:soluble lytic murein transglycosylase-like protein
MLAAAVAAAQPVAGRANVIEIAPDGAVSLLSGHVQGIAAGPSLPPLRQVRPAPASFGRIAPEAIEQEARAQGLSPDLLKAVAWQESRGRVDAVSPKGAIGPMQLMPGTARMMGVNPHDPVDNVRGGALYLRRQLERFGSVPLALAAYNAGPGAVLRHGGVPPFRETQRYVAAILQRLGQPPALRAAPVRTAALPFVIEVTGS